MTFSLRQYVKDGLPASGGPKEIAVRLLADLPDEHLREALAQALPDFVRVIMTTQQRPTLRQWDEMATEANGETPAIDMTVYAAGEWKPLDVATDDDFKDMADRRVRQAEGNTAWAARFRALAEGTALQPPAPREELIIEGLASVALLSAKRDRLIGYMEGRSSAQLEELRRRRDALAELLEIRRQEAERHQRVDRELEAIEAKHGAR